MQQRVTDRQAHRRTDASGAVITFQSKMVPNQIAIIKKNCSVLSDILDTITVNQVYKNVLSNYKKQHNNINFISI